MANHEKSFLVGLYRTMRLIRICEESFVEPVRTGEIRCPVHLCSGQEAVAAGVCASLEATDYVFGSHRSHGHYLAKGGDLDRMVAEVYCRRNGCAHGRGGSMHVMDRSVGMLGAAPIVGGTISLAVGASYAVSVRAEERVCVSFFGDGATGEGVLHESLNLAALLKLPVVFVCENNFYSTHLSISECRVSEEIYRIAEPLQVRTYRVDGNDVLAVFEAAREAIAAARAGQGPAFLEAVTYRMRGHVGPDDNVHGTRTDIRPPAEVAAWRARDPITRLETALLKDHIATEVELRSIDEEIVRAVARAASAAKAGAYPDPRELSHHVFTGT